MTAPRRERPALGRGVHSLIPGGPTAPSADAQVAAVLAGLRTVPVQAAVLQAAAVLLSHLADTTAQEGVRDAATATLAHLTAALDEGSPPAG
ncbi:hypothetical protein ACFYVL_34695 [Streptomyces sp. NPDC004111]|uniref:hypothetical protein n=1 Tax=Streptomyces sp. NPDC004111 TaxID=3364690 RepID=UPI0036C40473